MKPEFSPGETLVQMLLLCHHFDYFFKYIVHNLLYIKFSEFFSFSQQIHCRANLKLFRDALRIISALKAIVAITIAVFVPVNN